MKIIITYNKLELDNVVTYINNYSKWKHFFHYPWEPNERVLFSCDEEGYDWHYADMFITEVSDKAITYTQFIRERKLTRL
jgi:hypothetical protein